MIFDSGRRKFKFLLREIWRYTLCMNKQFTLHGNVEIFVGYPTYEYIFIRGWEVEFARIFLVSEFVLSYPFFDSCFNPSKIARLGLRLRLHYPNA